MNRMPSSWRRRFGRRSDGSKGRIGRAAKAASRPAAEPDADAAAEAAATVQAPAEPPVTIVADEQVREADKERARRLLLRVARVAPRPVLEARALLRLQSDPAHPAIAKASLDVSGRTVRAQVSAGEMHEAVDLLERRLRRSLEELEARGRSRRHETGIATPGEWRHGDLPAPRPDRAVRELEERRVARHATFASSALTPETAALELGTLDFAFHLFRNVDTGEENVVYRRPDGSTGLLWASREPVAPFAVDPAPAPVMGLDAAIERVEASGEPFVFFVDAASGHGNVVYVRDDGHYGVVEPAAP